MSDQKPAANDQASGAKDDKKELQLTEAAPIVTKHELKVGRTTLKYTATCGMMPLRNEQGEIDAELFFTAYTLDEPTSKQARPLMFSFNGGPGSSSVWLHLGGLGPKRVEMLDDGAMPAPPFSLADNDFTWLAATDLVFIDPVDTGYSRARTEELAKSYHGVDKDLASVGEFIRLYLSRYQRWASPLFLVGESYGTFRAAGLAGRLIEQGIAFNGIVLVSSVLEIQTLEYQPGNDLTFVLYLPTYTATAWYHGRLPEDLQTKSLSEVLAEVEQWAATEYTVALARGIKLSDEERAAAAEQLARYSGLSVQYVLQSNLRVQIQRFCKELLRDAGKTVGRLDSRYTGFDVWGVSETPDYDPSLSAIRPPYTSMLNDYVRRDLGYANDREYHILRGLRDWDWGTGRQGWPQTSASLGEAFAKNPYLHLFIASGFYDLATPYFATRYTIDHLPMAVQTRGQVHFEDYPVGHMVYLEKGSLTRLCDDVTGFIQTALSTKGNPLRGGPGS